MEESLRRKDKPEIESQPDHSTGHLRWFIYAITSMRESPVAWFGAAVYSIWIPIVIADLISSQFNIDIPFEILLLIGIVGLIVISFAGSYLRGQAGYIQFLLEWAAWQCGNHKERMGKDSILRLRWHFKAIYRVAKKASSNHFEDIIKAEQLARDANRESPMRFDQIIYGIELAIIYKSQSLPESQSNSPLEEYRDAYTNRFGGQRPTASDWASFLTNQLDDMPDEIKSIAAARNHPSIYDRLYPHVKFWHLFFTFVGAIILAVVTLVK